MTSRKLLIWLWIGLFAAQGPALAYATCCQAQEENTGAAAMGCCSAASCTLPPASDGLAFAKSARSHCSCMESLVSVPARLPSTAAESNRSHMSGSLLAAAADDHTVTETIETKTPYSWPPGQTAPQLTFLRVVTLLI